MLELLVASLVAFTPASEAPPKWEVSLGVIGGLRPAELGFGGLGFVGATRSLTSWLRVEALLGLGAYDRALEQAVAFRLGGRLEWPAAGRVRPFLYLAFAHHDEAPWDAFVADPLPVTIGFSARVRHRSGVDTGLGLSVEFPKSKSSVMAGRLMVRGSVVHLFGEGPVRMLELTVGVGACF